MKYIISERRKSREGYNSYFLVHLWLNNKCFDIKVEQTVSNRYVDGVYRIKNKEKRKKKHNNNK